MLKVNSPGATISYTTAGHGPTLVLIHGALSDHNTVWQAVRPSLEQRFKLVSIARRGRAESSRTTGHSIDDEASDVIAVIDAVGGDVYVLGHSHGAACALAAAMRSTRIKKLALYEPQNQALIAPAVVARMEDAVRSGDAGRAVEITQLEVLEVPPSLVDALKQTPLWQEMADDVEASLEDWRSYLRGQTASETLGEVTIPVLLLSGSESRAGVFRTPELAKALPNSRVAVLEGQGHAAMLTAPALFVSEVTRFLLDE